jgi:hypothetical protein
VVEATEDIARALGIKLLLLCSTCEEHVQSTWKHLGFVETSEADLEGFGVKESDLTHMQVGWDDGGGPAAAPRPSPLLAGASAPPFCNWSQSPSPLQRFGCRRSIQGTAW